MRTRQNFTNHNKIVIKVGTTTLTHKNGRVNLRQIDKLSWVISDLMNQGKSIILVSSGAIAVGAESMRLDERPRDTIGKQAASAVGQAALMQIYENFFNNYNRKIAQVLLTKDAFEDPKRSAHAKDAFGRLFEWGVVPIVNENDAVSVDEIEFSDNDALSAYVACLVEADALIVLSDIDGFYDGDPKLNKDAKIIPYIDRFDDDYDLAAGGSLSSLGTGGMLSKLQAAKMTAASGIDTVICSGANPAAVFDILNGYEIGTLFHVR